MKPKLISLFLCLALLAACLSGCGSAPAEVKETESPAPAETPASAETPAPTQAPADTSEETLDPETLARNERYRHAYEKYAPNTVVMLVDNQPITWSQYYSWIYDICSQVEPTYNVTDWNEPREEIASYVPDATFGSYVRKTALGYIVQIAVIGQKAKELGIELSEEQRSQLQATLDGYAERFGGQDAFEKLLTDNYVTPEYFREQNEATYLINNIYEYMYGVNGSDLPDADAVAYVQDRGYLYAKHILFRTVDDDRSPLPEDEIAQKKEEAEQVLAELQRCPPEDLPERFDALMQQYSEDTGLLRNPDGYYFVAGQMVPEFEEAVRGLEVNGLSGIVETDYGYHIIFTPPMQGDHIMGYDSNLQPYTPKAFTSKALFNTITHEWYTTAEYNVKYIGEFMDLDLNELFAD